MIQYYYLRYQGGSAEILSLFNRLDLLAPFELQMRLKDLVRRRSLEVRQKLRY